jgi:uncharacterized protein YegL
MYNVETVRTRKPRWYRALATTVVLALVVVGCSSPVSVDNPEADSSGAGVAFSIDLSSRSVTVDSVDVELTHSTLGTTVQRSLSVDQSTNTASGTITDLETGAWDISVSLIEAGQEIGTGSGSATVVAGQTATATITITLNTDPAYENPNDTTTTDTSATITQIQVGSSSEVDGYVSFTDQDGTPITGLNTFNFSIEESLDQSAWQDLSSGSITVTTASASGQAISTALTMDYSGSMSSTDVDNMETATKSFINNLNAGDQAKVIKFNTSVSSYPSSGFSSNKTDLVGFVDSSTPTSAGGSTALYDAVSDGISALDGLSGAGLRAAIAFTDGNDNASTVTEAQLISESNSTGIPIYSVGFGSADASALQNIATSGVYEYAPDSSTLQDIYDQIAQTLNETYVVSWDSIGSSGDTVYVRVTVEYTGANGSWTETTVSSYTRS